MKFLPASASYEARSSQDSYVLRRLTRGEQEDLKITLAAVHGELKAAEDRVEERNREVSGCLADRDLADDRLDHITREVKATEGGLSANAIRSVVFKMLFPHGITDIVWADVSDQVVVYSDFILRLRSASDTRPERTVVADKLQKQLDDWEIAHKDVIAARGQLKLARIERDRVRAKWDKTMVDTHAALVLRVGKDEAELFFPRKKAQSQTERVVEDDAEAEPPTSPTSD